MKIRIKSLSTEIDVDFPKDEISIYNKDVCVSLVDKIVSSAVALAAKEVSVANEVDNSGTIQWCYNYISKQKNSEERESLLKLLEKSGAV